MRQAEKDLLLTVYVVFISVASRYFMLLKQLNRKLSVRSWGTPPVEPNAHRSCSTLDISLFSTVSV